MSVAYLFPGQGAQTPGFLQRLPDHAAVRATLLEARQFLGEDLSMLDSAQALASTVAVQLGTLIAGVAAARAFALEGLPADAVAGLSVGAFAAAVACDALSFLDALSLVRLRGQAMQSAYPRGYGMAAIVGLDERQVRSLIEQAGSPGTPVYIANINAPIQIIIAGADSAMEGVLSDARRAGARKTYRMAVSVPSHCPLLAGVSQQLQAAMVPMRFNPPRVPYITNRRARPAQGAEDIREDLIGNVAHTVRWHDAVTVLYELGARLFVEPPPGRVLTSLAQESFPDARCVAIEEVKVEAAELLAEREHRID
jgi:malonate decarboxylase epsilon subunit